jgi:hypothetical protein
MTEAQSRHLSLGTEEVEKRLNQDIQCLDVNSNRVPPTYESKPSPSHHPARQDRC